MVTNTTAVTPLDIWQPSGYYFEPQRADQVSVGYFYQSEDGAIGLSSEVYFKNINNLLDFKDGADLTLNETIETELLQGRGYSYGVESSITKNTGRMTGQLNYTYSRTFRKIDGSLPTESINDGKKFPSNFDQPHVFNLSWKYELTKRHFFTGNFVYHSGRPITLPVAAFAVESTTATYFSGRNEYRIPNYHRLDIALVIEGNHRVDQRWKGAWVFSVYNLYARKNPYSIFFQSVDNGVPRPFRLSIIGTAFPSVTYKFTFK